VMPLGGKDTEPVIAALERNKRFLRGEVARMINLKFAPDVRFKVDDSFENASKIDQLLNSDKVRKDLASQTDDDADDAA